MPEPSTAEQLQIIESHWYTEAQAYRAAGLALRACLDGEERMQAFQQRLDCIVSSDALCDAYNDIKAASPDPRPVLARSA